MVVPGVTVVSRISIGMVWSLLKLLRTCLDAQACGDGLPQSVDKATLAAEAALTASEAPAKRWEALLARTRA